MADDVELADSLSTAMLLVLETLTPTERAVFLLRDVFDLGYDELAEAVGKTPAAVRQIAHRARSARRGASTTGCDRRRRRPGWRWRRSCGRSTPATSRDWSTSSRPTSSCLGDGGGVKQALPRPVVGADKVGRLLGMAMSTARDRGMVAELAHVNGWPALILRQDGAIDSVLSVRVEDGLVAAVYTVRNPHKLSGMISEALITR